MTTEDNQVEISDNDIYLSVPLVEIKDELSQYPDGEKIFDKFWEFLGVANGNAQYSLRF